MALPTGGTPVVLMGKMPMLLQTPDQPDNTVRKKVEGQPQQNIDNVHRLLLVTLTFAVWKAGGK